VATEPWELDDSPKSFSDYNWYADELPARKFYLCIAEIGHRLRHLMTDPGPINMIELCEQCGEGVIDENEISELSDENQPDQDRDEPTVHAYANGIYWYVADRYKVAGRGMIEHGLWAILIENANELGLLQSLASYEEVRAIENHPEIVATRQRTEEEWGALVRCIYGPNPFKKTRFLKKWRSESAVALARTAYDTRNFSLLPILADALEEAGCDNPDILTHCRQPDGVHARGCWVVDLVLDKG
jgi:hypothetical protein